jgi:adenine-specific DNA-methyltransferase
MQKLTGQTPDLSKENIDKIAALFPQVVTEKEGEDGITTRSVDFDLLRQLLSDSLVEGADERYRLDWPGKKRSLLKANTPIQKTLRPVRDESVDFDTTQNLFIEGDNFEALKILQESYLGKVKMIYIDPPYNTGKDFVYSDNFTINKAEYNEEIEAVDEEGNKMFRENTRTNPRFHSDWLSMMYERLIIARDLLRDDGVIFISIDDNEVHNLRKMCDEVFGEENFVVNFIWEKGKEGGNDSSILRSHHEQIVMYCKDSTASNIICYDQKDLSRHRTTDPGKNLVFGIEKIENEGEPYQLINLSKQKDYKVVIPLIDGTELIWDSYAPQSSIDKWVRVGKVFVGKRKVPYIKSYLKDELQGHKPSNLLKDFGTTKAGSIEMRSIFGSKEVFSFPKPSLLIKRFVKIGTTTDAVVLDFFAGSATTAHAVMQQNAEDGGNRKFIMVQLPEETPSDSEASKAGYKNIAELGRERIRRAATKIKADYAEQLAQRAAPLDTGFRTYRVADSAFLDVERHPAELKQEDLLGLADNIKTDRTPEDLLTQVMLELGLTLDLPIEEKRVGDNTVFYVASNALVACFDEGVPPTLIDEMAKVQPLQIAFRDSSFGSDDALINAETHLKRLSPDTILSII